MSEMECGHKDGEYVMCADCKQDHSLSDMVGSFCKGCSSTLLIKSWENMDGQTNQPIVVPIVVTTAPTVPVAITVDANTDTKYMDKHHVLLSCLRSGQKITFSQDINLFNLLAAKEKDTFRTAWKLYFKELVEQKKFPTADMLLRKTPDEIKRYHRMLYGLCHRQLRQYIYSLASDDTFRNNVNEIVNAPVMHRYTPTMADCFLSESQFVV